MNFLYMCSGWKLAALMLIHVDDLLLMGSRITLNHILQYLNQRSGKMKRGPYHSHGVESFMNNIDQATSCYTRIHISQSCSLCSRAGSMPTQLRSVAWISLQLAVISCQCGGIVKLARMSCMML